MIWELSTSSECTTIYSTTTCFIGKSIVLVLLSNLATCFRSFKFNWSFYCDVLNVILQILVVDGCILLINADTDTFKIHWTCAFCQRNQNLQSISEFIGQSDINPQVEIQHIQTFQEHQDFAQRGPSYKPSVNYHILSPEKLNNQVKFRVFTDHSSCHTDNLWCSQIRDNIPDRIQMLSREPRNFVTTPSI